MRAFLVYWVIVSNMTVLPNEYRNHASAGNVQTFLGVRLTAPGIKLLEEVQREYGTNVVPIEDATQREDIPALFKIDDNGTPSIHINPRTGKNEESIVHELMHLLGIARGVPWVNFHGQQPVDQKVVEFARADLYDMLFHAYFYPNLRKRGYKPEAAECKWLRAATDETKPLPTLSGSEMHASLALYYFRAAYICRDPELSNKLAKILSSNKQAKAVGEGKALVRIARRSGFGEPREVLNVFLAGANEIFKGQFRFSLTELKDSPQGHITQRTALIEVEPES